MQFYAPKTPFFHFFYAKSKIFGLMALPCLEFLLYLPMPDNASVVGRKGIFYIRGVYCAWK